MTNKFQIIIPTYNSEKWISKCILSILNQHFSNYSLTIINDNSSDKTYDNILDQFKNNIDSDVKLYSKISFLTGYNNKITIINNKERKLALYNIINGIKEADCKDEDIILLLDGDDWLINNDVLCYLDDVYHDENIWLTHGQFKVLSNNSSGNNDQVKNSREYRHTTYWCTSHLRTFKYKIWKQIKDEDFRNKDNKYYEMAWDLAIMYPLIEMSGLKRIKYIDKILYVYNDLNPLSDSKVDYKLQMKYTDEIRQKKQYEEIK